MAIALEQLAAGLPWAASFAALSGFTTLREGRRRTILNEAMHELRRPLQALALAAPAELEETSAVDSSLRLAAAALERLEAEVNGGASRGGVAPVRPRALVEAAARRWRSRAELAGGSLQVRWQARDRLVEGDECALSQLLDNLITNGLLHGGGEVVVEGAEEEDRLLVAVVDSGGRSRGARAGWLAAAGLAAGLGGRRRHGHGLRVVARTAAEHGGSFELRHEGSGARALLELPLLPEGGRG